jgi:hypothetical protein
VVDFNGDGRTDLIWSLSGGRSITIWTMQADGTVAASGTLDGCGDPCTLFAGTLDYNGDGHTDLFWLDDDNEGDKWWTLWRGQLDGSVSREKVGLEPGMNNYAPYFADINGDGSTDIFWDFVDGDGRSKGQRRLWLSKGDGTFVVQTNVNGRDGSLVGYRPSFGDFNGDGLPDILWVQTDSNGVSNGGGELWLGKGDGTFTVPAGQGSPPVGYVPAIADFNSDGKADIMWDKRSGSDTRSQGQRILWLSDGVPPDLITSVTTGIGANAAITYKPLTDNTVYTKGVSAVDPVVDLQGAMAAVARVDASNGIGGTVGTGYAYAGAKVHLDGRGFLGFQQMSVTDLQTGLVRTTTYRQDYPYVSLVALDTKRLGTATLNTTANTYEAASLGGTRFQVTLKQSQSFSADLDGTVLPAMSTSYTYGAYGNATQIVVSSSDGFSKTTTNTYANDPATWLLGRLTRASVTSLATPPAPPPTGPTEVVISLSTNSLNLWDYIAAKGLASLGAWKVTIASGVVIGSASSAVPALDTGLFPPGSTLSVINNGTIVGAGGKGGDGGACSSDSHNTWGTPGLPGKLGGTALRTQVPITIANNGSVWGGGGGGGGGAPAGILTSSRGGGGGGGGAGALPGGGGSGGAGSSPGSPGTAGTLSNGGTGGSPGSSAAGKGGSGGGPGLVGIAGSVGGAQCGSGFAAGPGGAAGPAVVGNSLITWTAVGDRRGPLN